jgi:hypothetical protein
LLQADCHIGAEDTIQIGHDLLRKGLALRHSLKVPAPRIFISRPRSGGYDRSGCPGR